jgi:hypothetical protein
VPSVPPWVLVQCEFVMNEFWPAPDGVAALRRIGEVNGRPAYPPHATGPLTPVPRPLSRRAAEAAYWSECIRLHFPGAEDDRFGRSVCHNSPSEVSEGA